MKEIINASMIVVESDESPVKGTFAIGKPIHSIGGNIIKEGTILLEEFCIITFLNALIDECEFSKEYEMMWTVGTGDIDRVIIGESVFDPNKNKTVKDERVISRTFSEQVFKLPFYGLVTSQTDKLIIKFFIREKNDENNGIWKITAITKLEVEAKGE